MPGGANCEHHVCRPVVKGAAEVHRVIALRQRVEQGIDVVSDECHAAIGLYETRGPWRFRRERKPPRFSRGLHDGGQCRRFATARRADDRKVSFQHQQPRGHMDAIVAQPHCKPVRRSGTLTVGLRFAGFGCMTRRLRVRGGGSAPRLAFGRLACRLCVRGGGLQVVAVHMAWQRW